MSYLIKYVRYFKTDTKLGKYSQKYSQNMIFYVLIFIFIQTPALCWSHVMLVMLVSWQLTHTDPRVARGTLPLPFIMTGLLHVSLGNFIIKIQHQTMFFFFHKLFSKVYTSCLSRDALCWRRGLNVATNSKCPERRGEEAGPEYWARVGGGPGPGDTEWAHGTTSGGTVVTGE